MYQLAPNAKVIFLLRDPVHRAYSHYRHDVRLDIHSGLRVMKEQQASERAGVWGAGWGGVERGWGGLFLMSARCHMS
jgi:hypothetical protein